MSAKLAAIDTTKYSGMCLILSFSLLLSSVLDRALYGFYGHDDDDDGDDNDKMSM